MIFTTYWFVLFGCVFLAAYYAFPFPKWRLVLVAAASILFYAHFSGPAGVSIIAVLGLATYLAGRSRRPRVISLAIALSALALVFYKYTYFLFENLARLAPGLTSFPISQWAPLAAPLAISFFVFEYAHYLVDVRRGNPPVKSPLDFLVFACFFPTLVAGPIKRYEQFVPALKEGVCRARFFSADVQIGFMRVVAGFAKKFVADVLTMYVNGMAPAFEQQPLADRWLVFTAIAFRIYFDFSGYSDIAIGAARMMGIRIPENFNWPYLATGIRDFWRRWHISLSTWIRDYIYIPLGGARVHPAVHGLNLVSVFVICGLWHGAAWNFVLWGLFHGCGLVTQQLAHALRKRVLPAPPPGIYVTLARAGGAAAGWALTTFFVWSGWLLFFYPVDRAVKMFGALLHA